MRLARIEVEDGDAALHAKVDLLHAGQRFERLAQHGQVFGFEIGDGKNGGFCAHRTKVVSNLTNPTRLRNRGDAEREKFTCEKIALSQKFLDDSRTDM